MKKSLSKKIQQGAIHNYRLTKFIGVSAIGLPLLVLGAVYSLSVNAEEAKTDKAATSKPETLPEVKVSTSAEKETATGPVNGYVAKRAISATKTDTSILEIPQSISVITADQIEDQKAQSIQEALRYSVGVVADPYGQDSRGDSYSLRGTEAVQYLDGLRHINTYYTETARPDPYAMERIEVLRGPSSMLYGGGGVGGIVNLVTKRPSTVAKREIGVQLGNYDRKQIQADFTGPVADSDTLFYRLVAIGRETDTQVKYAGDERTYIAPSLTWKPNDHTDFTLLTHYQRNDGRSTPQFLPWSGVLLPNPNGKLKYSTFLSEPDYDKYVSESTKVGWAFDHIFSDTWSFTQNLRYNASKNIYKQVLPSDVFNYTVDPYISPYIDLAQRRLNRYTSASSAQSKTFSVDNHAVASFSTANIEHKLLIGIDYNAFRKSQRDGYNFDPSDIDAYAPVYGNYTPAVLGEAVVSRAYQTGIYVQDQLKIDRNWIATLGLRHDRAGNRGGNNEAVVDHKVTGRYGLTYVFDNGWAPYVSYAESFTPLPGYQDVNLNALKPQEGKQWEAGIKYIPAGAKTKFTAAIYSLVDKNRPVGIGGTNFYTQKAEVTAKGLELELTHAFANRLDVLTAYSYTDAKYTGDARPEEKGNQVETIPKNLASLWTIKRFSIGNIDGFRSGLGLRYVGSTHDSFDVLKTPSVTLVDAMLGYDSGSWRYAVNASNLFDKEYVSTCLSRGDCWLGARRTAIASATYTW